MGPALPEAVGSDGAQPTSSPSSHLPQAQRHSERVSSAELSTCDVKRHPVKRGKEMSLMELEIENAKLHCIVNTSKGLQRSEICSQKLLQT